MQEFIKLIQLNTWQPLAIFIGAVTMYQLIKIIFLWFRDWVRKVNEKLDKIDGLVKSFEMWFPRIERLLERSQVDTVRLDELERRMERLEERCDSRHEEK